MGGTGKEIGDRHPKIGQGALIGASATILGNIEIGEGAMVGAGSLVMKDVPPHRLSIIYLNFWFICKVVLISIDILVAMCRPLVLQYGDRNTSKGDWLCR